jgi:Tfp pilus assembly protein PilX
VSPRKSIRRRRDRGFSLIVVFLLVVLMVGVAAQVLLSTQEDVAVSGQDRESLTSFYAAEYGVAQAKDWLEKQTQTLYPTLSNFSDWNLVLGVLQPTAVLQGCKFGPSTLSANPITPRMTWQEYNGQNGVVSAYNLGGLHAMWKFCIHNNSDDPAYLDSAHNADPGSNCSTAGVQPIAGDSCDGRDPLHYLTVDAWGAFPVDPVSLQPLPGASMTHLAVNIGTPAPRIVTGVGNCSYHVEGGCGSHVSNGGAVDTTTVLTGNGTGNGNVR